MSIHLINLRISLIPFRAKLATKALITTGIPGNRFHCDQDQRAMMLPNIMTSIIMISGVIIVTKKIIRCEPAAMKSPLCAIPVVLKVTNLNIILPRLVTRKNVPTYLTSKQPLPSMNKMRFKPMIQQAQYVTL